MFLIISDVERGKYEGFNFDAGKIKSLIFPSRGSYQRV